jgi:hypothetical protein
LLRLRRWLWKGLQRSVGDGDAGGCGGSGGGSGVSGQLAVAMVSAAVALVEVGSGVSGWLATAMVSAAVALAEAFASVVEAAVVGTVAV